MLSKSELGFKSFFKSIRRALFSEKQYHESQVETFSQTLISVTKNDEYLGEINKKSAHLNEINKSIAPHRAFSIFLFDQKNRLLLQQRADVKITYPNFWTNTCCSHPLHIPEEMEMKENYGIKLAAKKRLKFETNIDVDDINQFLLVEKIFYKSQSCEIWGENEVDYVLFLKKNIDYQIDFNKDEIKDLVWVDIHNILDFLEEKEKNGEKTTPWMKLILNYKLLDWWKSFESNDLVEKSNNKVIVFN